MPNKNTPNSRTNRFEKKRRGTKLIMWLAGAGSLLLVVFISVLIFGGNDQASNAKEPATESATEDNTDQSTDESSESSSNENNSENSDSSNEVELEDENKEGKNNTEEQSSSESKNTEQSNENKEGDDKKVTIEESDNKNVKRVVKKDWDPVPTKQDIEGEHRVKYDEGTQDWNELLHAVRNATGLSKDNMITWWVGNGDGPQTAYATVSDKDQSETMRVKVQWVEGKGYQPTQIEVLKKNPHKNN